jgi:single-strand DNA-binding protein
MGRITKDLELKYSKDGETTILSFTVAVNRMKKDTNEADFISCKAFNKTAENIAKFFGKGKLIASDGRIQTGSYDNKDGQKVYTTDVIVSGFHFTGEKKDANIVDANESAYVVTDDGELPF